MTKTKPQLMIASWPDRPVDLGHYCDLTATCSSTRVYLRHINPTDKWAGTVEDRAYSDLGLYVWASIDGTVAIDLRAMNIHSATTSDLEFRVKLLKKLETKASKSGFTFRKFHRDTSVYEQLIVCLDALGIHTAIEYHGINSAETYAPVALAVKRIADAIDSQLSNQLQKKTA
jgi:hypothetical protein